MREDVHGRKESASCPRLIRTPPCQVEKTGASPTTSPTRRYGSLVGESHPSSTSSCSKNVDDVDDAADDGFVLATPNELKLGNRYSSFRIDDLGCDSRQGYSQNTKIDQHTRSATNHRILSLLEGSAWGTFRPVQLDAENNNDDDDDNNNSKERESTNPPTDAMQSERRFRLVPKFVHGSHFP